jgi:hypothetical protein
MQIQRWSSIHLKHWNWCNREREREGEDSTSTFFTFSSWIMTHRVKNRVPLIQILKLLSWHYYVCNLSLSSSHCFYGILSSFNFVAVFSLIINVLITLIDLRCFCSNWIWCALLCEVQFWWNGLEKLDLIFILWFIFFSTDLICFADQLILRDFSTLSMTVVGIEPILPTKFTVNHH